MRQTWRRCVWRACALLVAVGGWGVFPAEMAIAGPLVSTAEALTPAEEKTKFHLPPGFEAQLVASEPDINKPMNLQFDARGRLWVSHSLEYPFAAPDPAKARDAISILDDFGPDGKARKITRFAEHLNIPIGVLPLGEGSSAIGWSIPYIWKFSDTTGSGHADKREILYGPFDYADTHGDQNAFRLGLDGWVYANHGFRNDSKIKLRGEGAVVLAMQSGNTYRFRSDGSAIEQFAFGQVNPFGSCWDERGQLYATDCHSRAISLLLRGGVYESFGKPHDGLGYAPTITNHDHGSTGLGGVAYYAAEHFPPEYRNCFYVNNVVTNRVHRDMPDWRGSSPWIEKPQDFLVSDDEWFHPVDVQLGPDGCLYVADFYNCIIGHYEVDLKHPRRDRTRGRIWRIVWKGLDGKAPPPRLTDLTKQPPKDLAEAMGSPNLTLRNLATHEAVRRVKEGKTSPADFQPHISSAEQLAQAMWGAYQLGVTSLFSLDDLPSEMPLVRVHAVKVLGALDKWKPEQAEMVRSRLADDDPFVRRAAAEALGIHPAVENVRPLLAAWAAADARDVQYVTALRIALRNQLRDAAEVAKLSARDLPAPDKARLAEIALVTARGEAAWLAFSCLRDTPAPADVMGRCLASVARLGDPGKADEVAAFARQKYAGKPAEQAALFRSLLESLTQKGAQLSPDREMGRWGAELATALLSEKSPLQPAWQQTPLPGDKSPVASGPFGLRSRASADGLKDGVFFDSLVFGEQRTGVLASAPFVIPERLSFYLCGHNGLPGTNPPPKNYLRLVLAQDGTEVQRALPPRNDTAQKVNWDLKSHLGKLGVIQVVDGDPGDAYAWIAVARFDPAVVENPREGYALGGGSNVLLAVQIAQQLKLESLAGKILALLTDPAAPLDVRIASADAGLALARPATAAALVKLLSSADAPLPLRSRAAGLLADIDAVETRDGLVAGLIAAPATLQQAIATALAAHEPGAKSLLSTVAAGKASPRLLLDRATADRLAALKLPAIQAQLADLTRNLPPEDARLNKLIAEKAAAFAPAGASPAAGQPVFAKHCAACHKLAGQGAMVGPQLDGIGVRGVDRLLEDIIDPSRNVDGAFRTTIVNTKGGLVIAGLKLREEGDQWVLADAQGKEVRVRRDEIETSRLSPLSLMPANVAETIPPADWNPLLAYLLSQKQKN